MGNKRNRVKRNKRQAANWRGIIKMRKPKTGNSQKGRKERTLSEIGNVPSDNYDQAQASDEIRNTENLEEAMTPFDLGIFNENSQHGPKNEPSLADPNVHIQCTNEQNYSAWSGYSQNRETRERETNRSTMDFDKIEKYGEIIEVEDMLDNQVDTTFDFDEWIEVDSDYNESQDNIMSEHDEQAHEHNQSELLENEDDVDSEIFNQCEQISASAPENITLNEGQILDNENDSNEYQMNDNDTNITVNVVGKRIVDMNFIFNQIKSLNAHSDECNFNDMEVVKETKMGLRHIFVFRCRVCGIEQKVNTSERDMEGMNINKAATLGITSTGCGFYNLEEFCAHIDVPCMSDKTFQKNNKDLQRDWWQLAQHHVDAALKEEIRLAKASGNVDSNGNALITVVCDGSWGKRSYGKGYSSLSGCAVLVGHRTKKVIYVDVKNKYCQTCANSYAANCPPNDHPCNINYEGPSSGMETSIIVEGFKHCAKLGARFPILIADGDASVFKELRELRLYKDPVIIIEKYECVNHLSKNFRKKFKAISKNTKYTSRSRKYMTISKVMDICLGIRMATAHWRNAEVDLSEKLNNLEKDCMNAPYHYFGQHDNCASYFCQKNTNQESIGIINLLKKDNIFQALLGLCQDSFASNVKSLLANYDTNAAESFNGLVAKFLGGKRINYSLAGSYKGRIGMAVVQFNSDYHGGSEFHKMAFDTPLDSCRKLENRRKRKLELNAIARQKKPRKKPTYDNEESQVGYGEGSHDADKTGRAFELALESEIAKLEENKKERETILQLTKDRENCAKWLEVRQNIITSFYFPRIINANNPKSYKNLTFEILYNSKEFAKTAERKHYKLYEEEALNAFTSIHDDHVLEKCGIFIDKELCFLGSTPLRLYGPESIVAVKCPLKGHNQSIDEAIDCKAMNFWKRNRGKKELFVNVRSVWYLEIQGELHVSDRKFAYLVVWLGEEKFKIEKIERDDGFWDSRMKQKLTFFFNESMSKELADPRRDRKMELREFDPATNTFV